MTTMFDRPRSGPFLEGGAGFVALATTLFLLAGCDGPVHPSAPDYEPFSVLSADPAHPTVLSCGGATGGLTGRVWRDPSGAPGVDLVLGQEPAQRLAAGSPPGNIDQNANYALRDVHGNLTLTVIGTAQVLSCSTTHDAPGTS